MPVDKKESIVEPVDAQVGGDADIDGIAQTITADDVNALLMSQRPIAERLDALTSMRAEIEARSHADFGNDMEPLITEIDAAIERLSSGR